MTNIEDAVSDALVELVDLPATLLDAAGLPVPRQNQGSSLMEMLTGKADLGSHKPYVLSEYFDAINVPGGVGSRGTMYCDGRYKLTVYHDANEGELFDLENDPHEFIDLWPDPAFRALRDELILKHFTAMMMVTGAGPARIADY